MEVDYDRRKRIRRLKKIILGTIASAIIIPIIICIILGIRVAALKDEVEELESILLMKGEGASNAAGVFSEAAIEQSLRDTEIIGEDIGAQQLKEDGRKEIYLTFDDGPSNNTDKILDILKEYDVKATFFVLGKENEKSLKAYKRIVDEGHTLGMHSYSHKYEEIYSSKESFADDIRKEQEFLYQVTGIWPRFYRFPGGSSNMVSSVDMRELIGYLNENGITYFDWNISSGDAVRNTLDAATIVENCISGIDGLDEGMILMHDANDKKTTVEALPKVIETIQARGDAVLLPITNETTPIRHISVGS